MIWSSRRRPIAQYGCLSALSSRYYNTSSPKSFDSIDSNCHGHGSLSDKVVSKQANPSPFSFSSFPFFWMGTRTFLQSTCVIQRSEWNLVRTKIFLDNEKVETVPLVFRGTKRRKIANETTPGSRSTTAHRTSLPPYYQRKSGIQINLPSAFAIGHARRN